MKKHIHFISLIFILLVPFAAQSQGSWNLVWREDFGIAEDTVLKDFPDPSMKVEGHQFAGRCTSVNDGYYAIANSTKWAVQRWADCNVNNNWFASARDHTGNDKGCMLIVNVGSAGKGEEIYRQDINFKLCSERRYKFTIFAASITGFRPESLADLTMQIVNKTTGDVIAQKKTDTIALWSGTDIYGKWTDSPFAEREWQEYSVEFTANDGDEISLLVLNHSPSGSGNDFVIDDISLYRADQYKIPEGLISTNVISSESAVYAGTCAYSAGFTVPADAVSTWKMLYSVPYYVWQKSTDDGLTWTTMTEYSGANKSSILMENLDMSVPEVYRVVTSGGLTESEAKTRTEYIAEHGGPAPADACAYYSVSNILAGVSPEPDCSYKENLKTIWKEDFGVMSVNDIKSSSSVKKLDAFTPTASACFSNLDNKTGNYAIVSSPSKMKRTYIEHNVWTGSKQEDVERTENCNERDMLDHSGMANGGMLYTRYKDKSADLEKNLLYEASISGPFCSCKSYIFSFFFNNIRDYYGGVDFLIKITDANGNELGINDFHTEDSQSYSWQLCSTSFEVPIGYTGKVYLRVYNNTTNNWNRVVFDDFSVSICQETSPKATLHLDENKSLRYLDNFDCEVTPPHIANLTDIDEWISDYPNYGYVWQMSRDGVSWTTISENNQAHYCEDLEDGETLYRVVLGETKAVAQQVAANGKPTDPCSVFFITNSVGLNCKGVKCETPADITITCSDSDKVLCTGETATLTPTKQSSATQFAQEWYKDGSIISGYPKTTDQAIYTVSDAGTYTVKVYDVENPTVEKCSKTAEIEIKTAERPTVTISGTADYCDGEVVSPAKFTFAGTAPYTFTYSDGTTTNSDVTCNTNTYNPTIPTTVGTKTYTISALKDLYCTAASTTGSAIITIKPIPTAVASVDGSASVCAGSAVTLKGSSDQASASYSWSGPNSYSSSVSSPVLTNTTTGMSGDYTLETTLNGCSSSTKTTITVNAIPTISDITSSETSVCSGTEITFSATTSDNGVGTAAWTTDETINSLTSNKLTASLNKTVASAETIKVTLNYSSLAGCPAAAKTKAVTINSIPAAPTVEDLSYCINASSKPLSATATGTLSWFDADKNAIAGTPTPSTASATTLTYFAKQTINNCVSDFSKLTVTVNDKITPKINISDADLCIGESANISVENADSYNAIVWEDCTAKSLYENASAKEPVFKAGNVNSKTDYTVKVSVVDANQCLGENAAKITVYPTPTVRLNTPDADCAGKSFNLTATVTSDPATDGEYKWSTNVKNATENSAVYSESTSGVVTYDYTSSIGCKAQQATSSITVYPIPEAPTTKPFSKCLNTESEMLDKYVVATGDLKWYDVATGGTASSTTPKPNTDSPVDGALYYVSQTVNGCESTNRGIVSVTVLDKLKPMIVATEESGIASNDGIVCSGEAISLSLYDTYKTVAWSGTGATYLTDVTIANPTFKNTAPDGMFDLSVMVTDNNNCSGDKTITLTVNPIPQATLTDLQNKCESIDENQEITATILPETITGVGTWTGNVSKKSDSETVAVFNPKSAKTGTHTISYSFESSEKCAMKSPVSKTVEVFADPVISITPSVTTLCESGANSGDVSMKMSGTYNTTGEKTQIFKYSSATLTGINSETGQFNSVGQIAENHKITLEYTDANGCPGNAETSVTINARPVADITENPTEICDYASPITLMAKVNGTVMSGGSFTGSGVTGTTFTPSTQIKGANAITYRYTDENNCTSEEKSMTIMVNHTDVPEVTSTSASKLDVTSQAEVPALIAVGDNIKWYSENDTTSEVKATGTSYTETFVADGDGKMKVGTYTLFATQTQNGCQSVPKEVSLTITDCAAKAPTGNSYHACVDDENNVEITATSNEVSSDNFCWFTDRNNIPAGSIATLTDAQSNAQGNGATYIVDKLLFDAEKTITIYVSEYYEPDHCFSAPTPVTINVHARPVPTITNPGNICSTVGEITVTYAPTSSGNIVSTLSAENGVIEDNKWKIFFDETKTGETSTKLTVTTVETWGGSKECISKVDEIFTVTNVLAPTGTGIGDPQMWSSSKLGEQLTQKFEINYSSDIASLSVTDDANTEIGTASPIDMKNIITKEGTYTYNVSQTLNGCSASAVSVWNVVECPTPAPEISDMEICVNDDLPTLEVATSGAGIQYQWLKVENDEDVVLEGQNEKSLILKGSSFADNTEAKTYIFKVKQDGDDGAGGKCFGPAAIANVIVHALPDVEIQPVSEDDVICYGEGKITVEALVNGKNSRVVNGGIWSIVDETSGITSDGGVMDPTFKDKIDGTYTIQYYYQDENGCEKTDLRPISIEYPTVPTTNEYIGITDEPVLVTVTAGNIETTAGTVVNWEKDDLFKSSENPWIVAETEINPNEETDGILEYAVTQIVRGCKSEPAIQKIQIVSCPWTVENTTSTEVCLGDSENILEMNATAQSEAEIKSWKWIDEKGTVVSTTNTFKQTDASKVGTTSYFVQYEAKDEVSGKYCWTPTVEVTTTVLSLPTIEFEQTSGIVCYTDDPTKIIVSAKPGTNGSEVSNGEGEGSWAITGASSGIDEKGYFNAKANDAKSGTYTITYKYVDGKSCENSAARTIDVIYLDAPKTTSFFAMNTQKNDVQIRAQKTDSENEIRWFTSNVSTRDIVGNEEIWKTGDSFSSVISPAKTYFARQFLNGCYSEPTEATVEIVDCPIPNVTIENQESCVYDEIPTLTAVSNGWENRDASLSTFKFYTSNEIAESEYESKDGSYKPTISAAGEYTYYVSEFNSIPLLGLTNEEGCQSKRTKVVLVIKETQKPALVSNSTSVCWGKENPVISASNTNGEVDWFEENPGENGIPEIDSWMQGDSYIPQADEVGEHSVWAVNFNEGCYSERTEFKFTIKPIPTAPNVTGKSICYGEETESLTAEGDENAVIVWYADERCKKSLLRGKNTYTSRETNVDTYLYYVTQIVNSCESPAAEVSYRIKPIPVMPDLKEQSDICEYEEVPTLHAYGDSITWYAMDKIEVVGEGNDFQASDSEVGNKRFYVTQTQDGCEGRLNMIAYRVIAKPANPIVVGARVCQGDTLIPTLSTNSLFDVWYVDEDASVEVSRGYTYTPDVLSNENSIYYVQRNQAGCRSDVVADTLYVIKTPTFSIGEDLIGCVYDSVKVIQALDFNPPITSNSYIAWTISQKNKSTALVDGIDHSIQPVNQITKSGTYTISAYYRYKYDNVSCNSDMQSISYTIKDRPHQPYVFSTTICAGDDIAELRSTGTPRTVWNSLDNTLPATWHGQSYKFQPGQSLDTGLYRFEIYDMSIYDDSDEENLLGCESFRDTISLIVAPGAKTKLFGSDSVCIGSVGESYYTQYEKGSQYHWSVTGEHLNYSKDANSTSVRYIDWMSSGIDTITVYEQTWAGCEGFDTLIVKIAPAPEARFVLSMPGASNLVEMVDSTLQDSLWTTNEEGGRIGIPITYNMAWNFGHIGTPENQIDTIIPFANRHRPIQEGGYLYGYNCPILTVTNDFGCTSTYSECIFVNIASSLYVPTAFSPTNPAHSVRSFAPKGFNIATCEISVYDKWGNLLWFSNEVEDGMFVGAWDGRYEGKMMKSDVYIWKMEATFLDGQKWQGFDAGNGKKTKFGSVTLIR